MTIATPVSTRGMLISELLDALGDIPANRVIVDPAPGTATEEDLLYFLDHEDRPCELVNGTLVEKAVGFVESVLAVALATALANHVRAKQLGVLTGEQGPYRLQLGLVRLPDIAYVPWTKLPANWEEVGAISSVIPELTVEIISKSNTRRELELKRKEYFSAGVRLVWIVDPKARAIAVYTSPETPDAVLGLNDVLTGGTVLPDFKIEVSALFAEVNRLSPPASAGQGE